MRLILSFAALLSSVALLQLSSGGVGPLDAISGLAMGFTRAEVGFLGSAHFLGFFAGCWWAPRLMGTVGHSRAFAAFGALGAIGILSHMMFVDPYAWAAMRLATGLSVAGAYTVIEAWLHGKITNATRGRAMGIYRVVDLGASLAAQLVISVLEPAQYLSYNVLALVACAAVLPLTLTRSSPPPTPSAPRLRPRLAMSRSPLAAAGAMVAGLTGAAFRMVGPIYGQEVGLRPDQIGLFLAAFVAGGAVAQFPLGWLADKFDRRVVLIGLSAAAILTSLTTIAASGSGTAGVMLASALFGFTTFPIYSVAAAHAHDFARDSERVELSAALMFFFALGAIASPLVASGLIELYGPAALFQFLAAGHLLLIVFGLGRMRARPAAVRRTRYVYVPRTTFLIGRLLKQRRKEPLRGSREEPGPPGASGPGTGAG